jgi:hypothetical protein
MAELRRTQNRVIFSLIVLLAMILLCSGRHDGAHQHKAGEPRPDAGIEGRAPRLALSEIAPTP